MDKWAELRLLLEATLSHNVQYSYDKAFDRYSYQRVMEWMDSLEKREKKEREKHESSFLFTGVPTFDQKAWDEILESKGLQGLS